MTATGGADQLPADRRPALVLLRRDGAVATVQLNRPDALNTMTAGLLEELLVVLEEVHDNPEVQVLVLSGTGRAFCAGGDLRAGVGGAVGGPPPLASQSRRLRTFMRVVQLLRSMPAVTVAAVHGACAGAGLSLACATDLRICQEGSKFATAFLGVGLSGDFGGTWLLPRVVGGGRARDLYLLPRTVAAEEALAIGLVSQVCPDVHQRAQEVAAELAARAPVALRQIKATLNDAEELGLSALLDLEADRHSGCAATLDAAEATQAFLQHREPVFEGR